jgi:uncharacterized beta-barrel protein YwiB (DUF1934 family)
MKQTVLLSITGRQVYLNQEPEIIELVTEGIMYPEGDGWNLCYEESALTGLEGVTTTFHAEPDKITLTRTGKLNSQMVFQVGVQHDSLYQLEFGALMISVCATKVETALTADGGTIDLVYGIEIEQSEAGTIEYHLDVRSKE